VVAELRAPALAGSGSGGGGKLYVHTQSAAASSWTVPHNFGQYPSAVLVRLDSGEIVETDRDDLDLNTTVLTMVGARSGIAEVSV